MLGQDPTKTQPDPTKTYSTKLLHSTKVGGLVKDLNDQRKEVLPKRRNDPKKRKENQLNTKDRRNENEVNSMAEPLRYREILAKHRSKLHKLRI
jgi:hypothetical protein